MENIIKLTRLLHAAVGENPNEPRKLHCSIDVLRIHSMAAFKPEAWTNAIGAGDHVLVACGHIYLTDHDPFAGQQYSVPCDGGEGCANDGERTVPFLVFVKTVLVAHARTTNAAPPIDPS